MPLGGYFAVPKGIHVALKKEHDLEYLGCRYDGFQVCVKV